MSNAECVRRYKATPKGREANLRYARSEGRRARLQINGALRDLRLRRARDQQLVTQLEGELYG